MEGDAAKPEAIAAWNHFNPLPPHGGRLAATAISTMPSIFQSTPSAWRETTKNKRTRNILKNFNPLPPHGGRPPEENPTPCNNDYFNPLPPHGGRPIREKKEVRQQTISIHSLRMEGDRITLKVDCQESISIHSLRMEGDSSNATVGNYLIHISIHSLRMEGDSYVRFSTRRTGHFNPLPPHGGRHAFKYLWRHEKKFQSTPSAWRETNSHCVLFWNADNFNPLPPHGGRPVYAFIGLPLEYPGQVSLHAEGDRYPWSHCRRCRTRSGLPPCGGRPDDGIRHQQAAGRHQVRSPSMRRETKPHPKKSAARSTRSGLPPCGGRHVILLYIRSLRAQVRSPSMRRETYHGVDLCAVSTIPGQVSLHAEGDSKTAQESVFHFAYPCTILQKRMQKTTFCTRKNGFFRKKGEKFGAKPSASFCAPMIRTDTFPLNFSHRISGSSMSMVSFAPICSTFD